MFLLCSRSADSLGGMGDRILTSEIAAALHRECLAEGEAIAWFVCGTAGELVARPVTSRRGALPYVLTAATLAALRAQLPARLKRSPRMPADPENVVEIWLPA